jgi:hypothetical protein
VNLTAWLTNSYHFDDATINVDIAGSTCTYTINGDRTEGDDDSLNGTITGITDVEAARTAWAALTSHVSATGDHPDDSYITIKAGSWLQIGNYVLRFHENVDDLKLDKFSDLGTLFTNIQAHAWLVTAQEAYDAGLTDVVTSNNSNTVKAFLKAESTLAVSSSWAVLNNDATIVISGLNLSTQIGGTSGPALGTVLNMLREAANDNSKEGVVMVAIMAFDTLVKAVDDAQSVDVNITFGTA